ncbi:MAG: glycosyltransferase family 61 protein [Verrucomicrobiales bacterium]|jgi:hypothetical protein|nr:glycosyltransferase family 61 protein [Verrucomicrobiales bacterium]
MKDIFDPYYRYEQMPFVFTTHADPVFNIPGWKYPEHGWRAKKQKLDPPKGTAPTVSFAIFDEHCLYCHVFEIILVFYTVWRDFFPQAKVRRIYWGEGSKLKALEAQGNLIPSIFEAIFPSVEIIYETNPEPHDDPIVFMERMKSLGGYGKCLECMVDRIQPHARDFRDLIFKAADTTPKGFPTKREEIKILYSKRASNVFVHRNFTPNLENDLLNYMDTCGKLTLLDFSSLTWQEQVRLACQFDILIGVHGNNLTNLLWLPEHGQVIEFFPDDKYNCFYQYFAEALNIGWHGLDGDKVYSKGYRLPPFGMIGNTNGCDVTKELCKLSIRRAFEPFIQAFNQKG